MDSYFVKKGKLELEEMMFVGRFVGILKIVLKNLKLNQRHMITVGCLFKHQSLT